LHVSPITSLSERTARRYMALLLLLLAVSIVLGYAVNSAKSTTGDVNKVISEQVANVDLLQTEIRSFKKAFDANCEIPEMAQFPVDGNTDMLAAIDKMQKLGSQIDQAADRANVEISTLMRLLWPLQQKNYTPKPADTLDSSIAQLRLTINNFYARQSYIARTTPRIDGIAQSINFALLPVLLGRWARAPMSCACFTNRSRRRHIRLQARYGMPFALLWAR
jgi:hypothetical protein